MPIWRCPHCGTPQAESARCWVCRRSTTSCATCRHFRRAVAGGLGLCGLDPRHTALRGTEMRPCWAAPDPVEEVAARVSATATRPGTIDDGPRARTFVPLDELEPEPHERDAVAGPGPATAVPATSAGATSTAGSGWSLWSDAER